MGLRYDLAVFDMDGVLTSARSSWGYVHDEMGVSNEHSLKAFMDGEIDEDEFIKRDLALWLDKHPDFSIRELVHILRTMPLTDGIQETVACLQYNRIKCVICSGGIEIAARMLTEEYGFDGYAAVEFETDGDGVLTGGFVKHTDLGDKGIRTREFIKEFGTTPERTVTIGNSFTDVKMMEGTGMKIAFNPIDQNVIDVSDVVIRSGNISDVLDVILGSEERA